MKRKILGVLLGLSSLSFANEVCNTNSNELMSQLVSNHPSIKMSQEIIKASKYRADSAYWNFYPTPSINVSAKDSDRYTTTARLEQPLWTGGKLTSQYDITISKEKESLNELKETSFKLIETYLTIMQEYTQAKARVIELKEGLKNLNELKQMLKRRIKSGVSSDSDKELLTARIKQIQNDLALSKNIYKTAHMQLELLLDKRLSCDINLEEISIGKPKSIEESINKALLFHPSISKIDSQIQTAKYELDSVKASVMPTLSLRAEYTRGDLYNDGQNDSSQSLAYISFSATTNAGLSILSDIKGAKVKINEFKFRKKTLEKEITDSLLKDFNNYEIVKNRISILKESVNSSENVLNSYKRLFLVGKRQWLNLVDSSRELMNYKIALSNTTTTKEILTYKLALKYGKIDLLNGEFKDGI